MVRIKTPSGKPEHPDHYRVAKFKRKDIEGKKCTGCGRTFKNGGLVYICECCKGIFHDRCKKDLCRHPKEGNFLYCRVEVEE